MNIDLKSGFKTSEFWMSVSSQVLSFLLVFGVITTQDMSNLQGAVSSAIAGIFATVNSCVSLWSYIRSRLDQKNTVLSLQAQVLGLKLPG